MKSILCEVLILSTLLTGVVGAQDVSAVVIAGSVLDPQQAGVAGAKVNLTRRDGTKVQSTTADSAGAFRFQGVPIGDYDVRIEQQGFKSSVFRVRVGNQ